MREHLSMPIRIVQVLSSLALVTHPGCAELPRTPQETRSTRATERDPAPQRRPGPNPTAGIVPRLVAQTGHAAGLTAVATSPDGRLVATGAEEGPVILWQASTGRELLRLEGSDSPMGGLVFAGAGPRLFGVDLRGDLFAWNVADGSLARRLHVGPEPDDELGYVEPRGFLRSPDGARLLLHYAPGGSVVLDLETLDELERFEEGSWRMAFGPSGEVLGLELEGEETVLSNLSRGAELWRLPHVGDARFFDEGRQVLLLRDGERDLDWILRGVAAETGEVTWSVPLDGSRAPGPIAASDGASNTLLEFAPDMVIALDATTLATRWERIVRTSDPLYPGLALAAAFDAHGSRAATIHQDRGTRVWDVATGELLATLRGGCDVVRALALSEDGSSLLVGQGEGAILWSTDAGAERRRIAAGSREGGAVALSRDGERLLTLTGVAHVWDTARGERLARLSSGYGASVVALSPDGTVAAFAGGASVEFRDVVADVSLGRTVTEDETSPREVRDAAFTPDGNALAFVGEVAGESPESRGGWVSVVEVPSGAARHRREVPRPVNAVACSPDGARILVGGEDTVGGAILDAHTGESLLRLATPDGVGVRAVAFSPDGSRALVGLADHTARVCDVNEGDARLILAGHDGPVTAVAYTPDASRILTASDDHTIRVWSARDGAELGRMISFPDGTWAVVDGVGRFDAANGGDVEGLHWVVGQETIALEQLKERYYEPGLLAKLLGRSDEPLRDVRALAAGVQLPPDVEILQRPTAEDPTLRFSLTDRGGGIGRVEVRVNRKQVTADARGENGPGGEPGGEPSGGRLEVSLSLADHPAFVPGAENAIEILPYDAGEFLSARGLQVRVAAGDAAGGDLPALHAVVAGVSDYSGTDLDLRFAARDAEVMGDALERAGRRLFGDASRVHVTRLVDGDRPATRAALDAALDELARARWFDVVVVYLAGHGVTHGGVDGDYYYLTQDARSGDLSDPAVRASRAISSHELKERLAALPARKQVLILDTCYAGQLLVDLTTKREVPASQVRALERLKDQTGTFLLAGSASDSVSYEASPFGHGLLTYSLLRAMKDALRPAVDGEGRVDVMGLFATSQEQVPLLARGLGGVQRPQVAMPGLGESFAIGQLAPEDRAEIALERPLPVLVSASFELADQPLDPLGLTTRVHAALGERAAAAPRAAGFFLAEGTAADDAWRLAGRYRRASGRVTLTAYLYLGEALVDTWGSSASEEELGALVNELLAWAEPQVH